ncbi:hypothetical protein [Bacillus altitudinis]|uniref:hypothetical protein n=1 Tax=Bacillus altitudinis TaxID=293387 RepID=UPI003B517FFE
MHNFFHLKHLPLNHHIPHPLNPHVPIQKDLHYLLQHPQLLILHSFTPPLIKPPPYTQPLHQPIQPKQPLQLKFIPITNLLLPNLPLLLTNHYTILFIIIPTYPTPTFPMH